MDFPIVTIRDFVNVQKALLESLGITRLHAVMGASMGALQAYEWAVAYPDMVERLIPVIGAGVIDPFNIGWMDVWAAPIRLDPNWNGGDYYGKAPPLAGLTEALKIVTLHAQHWAWADETFGRAWAEEGKDPAAAFDNVFAIEAALEQAGAARAAVADANHFLYLAKANQLFSAGHGDSLAKALGRIEAPTLIIHQPEDLIFYPALVQQTADLIAANDTPVQRVGIAGARGASCPSWDRAGPDYRQTGSAAGCPGGPGRALARPTLDRRRALAQSIDSNAAARRHVYAAGPLRGTRGAPPRSKPLECCLGSVHRRLATAPMRAGARGCWGERPDIRTRAMKMAGSGPPGWSRFARSCSRPQRRTRS
jgi:pimeloyl-ACP methyl ester carboxylesterase